MIEPDLMQKYLQLLTPEKTMEIVLDTIEEIIPFELAVILSRESNEYLKVRYAHGPLASSKLRNFKLQLTQHPEIIEVLQSGKVKVVEETVNPEHRDTYDGVIDLPAGHSCMLAPLLIDGEVVGLMTLDHSSCDIFTPQRVAVANSLAKLIALALVQAISTDSLLSEKEALMYERTSLLGNIGSMIEGLVGNSPVWIQVLEKIKLVAPTDSHVMILGETGTGKELVAKAIHTLSKRSAKPFITLNCSALNYNLAESELFGHEKGAFTGAISSRRGRFELADEGTLFLDEIADLPIDIQPKLLRAIQEGTFERLGSEKTLNANVRIICATNVDLEQKVKEGKFREDLFYRLNVFPIQLPPLRERKEDIYLLANYFIQKFSIKFNNKNIILTPDAINVLYNNPWYGNVRELQNVLERAIILSKDGVINPEHLIFQSRKSLDVLVRESNRIVKSFNEEIKEIIEHALKLSNGKIYGKNGAAALLKLKPTTLQSKMKKLGIKR